MSEITATDAYCDNDMYLTDGPTDRHTESGSTMMQMTLQKSWQQI
jgi:hypothetical protein